MGASNKGCQNSKLNDETVGTQHLSLSYTENDHNKIKLNQPMAK